MHVSHCYPIVLEVSNGVYREASCLELLCVVSFEVIDSLQNASLNETAISVEKRAVSEGEVCPLGLARGSGGRKCRGSCKSENEVMRVRETGSFSAWAGERWCPARRGVPACV